MVVSLNSIITGISKNISIKQHFPIKKYPYGSSIEHKSISVR